MIMRIILFFSFALISTFIPAFPSMGQAPAVIAEATPPTTAGIRESILKDGSIKESPATANNLSKQIAPLPPIDFSSSLLSMLKGLAICIALLLLVVWVLKKLKSPIVTGHGRSLKIIERLPVSAKSSILLIEVNNKRVLIGVGSEPVSLISDFVDSESLGIATDEPNGGKND